MALALSLTTVPVAAQSERVDVVAVEVPVIVRDASGQVPRDLTPRDFLLSEDGVAQEVLGVAYLDGEPQREVSATTTGGAATAPAAARGQVVIYLQQSLSTSQGLQQSLTALTERAGELVAIGDVEVVSDSGGRAHSILPPTRDVEVLRPFLQKLASSITGEAQIARHRRQYLDDVQQFQLHSVSAIGPKSNRQNDETEAAERGNVSVALPAVALAAAGLEARIIEAREAALLRWLGGYTTQLKTRVLLLVSDGWDSNPIDFYAPRDQRLEPQMRALSGAAREENLASSLAAMGWTAVSLAPAWMSSAASPTFDPSNRGGERVAEFNARPRADASTPVALLLKPLDVLRTFALETGGSVDVTPANLSRTLQRIRERVVLTYRLQRPRDGKLHRIHVASLRPGLTVQAQRWTVSGSPDSVALARASALAATDGERGELPVTCSVRVLASKPGTSTVEATVNITPLEALRASLTAATLRFSMAVLSDGALPFTISRRMERLNLAAQTLWRADFEVQHAPGAVIGLVVEELSTGIWGGSRCDASGAASAASAQPPATPKVVLEAAPDHTKTWLPLTEALARAKAARSLVLLHVVTASPLEPVATSAGAKKPAGVPARDAAALRWLAGAETRPAVAQSLDVMVLARESAQVFAARDSQLAPYLASGRNHLLLLDWTGAVVAEPSAAFGDLSEFAVQLNTMRQQTAAFARAADLSRQGRIPEALVARGNALLAVSWSVSAMRAFEEARQIARESHDDVSLQHAQLGIASAHLSEGKVDLARPLLEELTRKPASPEVEASAWLLLGHTHRDRKRTAQAIDAYQHAWRAAPKETPLAEAARRFLEMLGSEPAGSSRASSAQDAGVHLLYPHRDVLVGSIDVAATVPPGTARLELYLDDARVAESKSAPFRERISLGSTPRKHTLRAIAYDARNTRLGQETVTLNDVVSSLAIAITAPQEDVVEERSTIEVEPRVPSGRQVAGVDLYWNEQKVATLARAPYRFELVLPSKGAAGYVRAVVRDDSGATAEDVKMLNVAGGVERIRVNSVQLHAIVSDRNGRPVEGLTASDFLVKEDGKAVEVALASTPADPITVGLALDTSTSMQTAMIDVIEYANEFVTSSLVPGDETFVVGFDERPHLAQPLTADRQKVSTSIYNIRPGGATALWDAVLYSLKQFQGVSGKRALLFFTDGQNTGGSASATEAMRYAREAGVPIYVVLMFTGRVTHAGDAVLPPTARRELERASLAVNEPLRALAETTGGAFFRYARKQDLPQFFGRVRDDTRGEYLLTYVSPSTRPLTQLRQITISVPRKPVTVRAPSGYIPR